MPKLTEKDAKVTLMEQMETDVSPVVLINRFSVAPGEVDQLVKAWAADAAFLKTQPGYISAQLYRASEAELRVRQCRGLGVGRTFQARFHAPDVSGHLAGYPASAVASPHLFSKVTVPNICVAG